LKTRSFAHTALTVAPPNPQIRGLLDGRKKDRIHPNPTGGSIRRQTTLKTRSFADTALTVAPPNPQIRGLVAGQKKDRNPAS
jgi:hypothetical protein